VQVPYDEGVANHIGPESCADIREGVGEALTGERTGQPLSRENDLIPGADAFSVRKAMDGRANASARRPGVVGDTWHVRTLFVREPGDLTIDQQ
jgi:hypothetical protein